MTWWPPFRLVALWITSTYVEPMTLIHFYLYPKSSQTTFLLNWSRALNPSQGSTLNINLDPYDVAGTRWLYWCMLALRAFKLSKNRATFFFSRSFRCRCVFQTNSTGVCNCTPGRQLTLTPSTLFPLKVSPWYNPGLRDWRHILQIESIAL